LRRDASFIISIIINIFFFKLDDISGVVSRAGFGAKFDNDNNFIPNLAANPELRNKRPYFSVSELIFDFRLCKYQLCQKYEFMFMGVARILLLHC